MWNVDRPRAAVVVVAPDALQQGLAREDAVRVSHEEPEQLVLHVGEADRLAVDGDQVGGRVELERAGADRRPALHRDRCPGRAGDARLELGERERLDDQLVGRGEPGTRPELLGRDDEDETDAGELVALMKPVDEVVAGGRLGAEDHDGKRGPPEVCAVAHGGPERLAVAEVAGGEAELGEARADSVGALPARGVDPDVAH
jgi:hypothetical protein